MIGVALYTFLCKGKKVSPLLIVAGHGTYSMLARRAVHKF